MQTTVVIPSYWGRSWKEPICFDDDVYDHPTPIDQEGSLKRALDSFAALENKDFNIVVIGVAAAEEFRDQCQEKLRSIIKETKASFPITLFSYSQTEILREKLKERDQEKLVELISLQGYSNVRNACIISAILTNAEIAIFFDDDEIINDSRYISKAREFMGEKSGDQIVFAKAGYYIRPESDTYEIPPQRHWVWAEWDGAQAMNKAFEIIANPPRLKLTPFTFGGNMVVHHALFSRVAFDPNVRRGEDIDYLVNAKMFGYDFLLDNELYIKHLPPESRNPGWQGFRENIYRFVYSREKLLAQKPKKDVREVEMEEMDPYPGVFLRDDLQDRIYKTSLLLALDYLARDDREGFEKALENIAVAKYDAKPDFDPFEWYLDYNSKWQELTSLLSEDSSFQILG